MDIYRYTSIIIEIGRRQYLMQSFDIKTILPYIFAATLVLKLIMKAIISFHYFFMRLSSGYMQFSSQQAIETMKEAEYHCQRGLD